MTKTERSDTEILGDVAPEVSDVARPEIETVARSSGHRERTCVGCGERVDKSTNEGEGAGAELIRLILGPNGEVAVDAAGGGFGRGAYVHARRDCLSKAVTRGLAKAAKGRVSTLVDHEREPAETDNAVTPASTGAEAEPTKLTLDSLAAAVRAALARRISGLLIAAGRSRALALGADAATGAWERGEAALIVVACDAAAGAELPAVRRAVVEGRAVAWGSKLELGSLCSGGRGRKPEVGVAVVAVKSKRIAAAIRDAVHSANACLGPPSSGHSPLERKRESKAAASSGGVGAKNKSGDAAGAAAVRCADGTVG